MTTDNRYRLTYDEITVGLTEAENPHTGLPEYIADGAGFHTTVRLERFDTEYDDWIEIDSESVDGPDAEANEPYNESEQRLLDRNGLNRTDIETTVTAW